MLLEDKNAVIYGAGGRIGSTVARAFARQGARIFLAGRTRQTLEAVAEDIAAIGGSAEVAEVDALDERAVGHHADAVVEEAGGIDVSFNAIWIRPVQGTPLAQMSREDFMSPIVTGTGSHFLTAKAAARHMVQRGSGVILTLSTSAARLSGRGPAVPPDRRLRGGVRRHRGAHDAACRRAGATGRARRLPQARRDPPDLA